VDEIEARLTKDEARHIAINIARLPGPLVELSVEPLASSSPTTPRNGAG
jgi:hypothetical protein